MREAELRKLFPHRYKVPHVAPSAFVAPGCQLIGDVVIGEDSSVWFNSVLRGDVSYIRIGKKTNIQDLSMVHVSENFAPTIIGDNVTVGHCSVLHGCTIKNNSLIGMGSLLMDDAEIGEHVLLGAGSLVTKGTKIPPGTKAFGRPAKVVGDLTQEEIKSIAERAIHYSELAKSYFGESAKHFSVT